MTKPYRVFAVVDREYGQCLTGLTQVGRVWIVDTPANRAVAQQIWDTEPTRSHLQGITTFKCPEDGSPEDILVNELDTIDLHHGKYSANPRFPFCFSAMLALLVPSTTIGSRSSKPEKSTIRLSADEIAVYKAVLRTYSSGKGANLNVSAQTYPLDPSASTTGFDQLECLNGVQLENLSTVSHSTHGSMVRLARVSLLDTLTPLDCCCTLRSCHLVKSIRSRSKPAAI